MGRCLRAARYYLMTLWIETIIYYLRLFQTQSMYDVD